MGDSFEKSRTSTMASFTGERSTGRNVHQLFYRAHGQTANKMLGGD
jgi:hypothetical protein